MSMNDENTTSAERADRVKRASYVAIAGNSVLAVLKIAVGLFSGSRAVVGDGIDTTTDIIASAIILFAALLMSKPPDKEHPYGHSRIEVLATKLVSFVIFFVGAQLALSTIRSLISSSLYDVPHPAAIVVTILSIAGKAFLARFLWRFGQAHESPMVLANARNMLSDISISALVLVGLVLSRVFERSIIDAILAVGVSIWVMKTAVTIFMDSSIEVMESVRDHSVYDRIFEAVEAVDGASNPHRTRIRQISNLHVVDLDIEVDPRTTVEDGHEIAMRVERAIKDRVRSIYDIMVHVEPKGNAEAGEKYGRSESEG